MSQKTHELWAKTRERGEFLVYAGRQESVERVGEDLQDLLDGMPSNGHILVNLPSEEIVDLTIREVK